MQVESWLGSVFVLMFALFAVGVIFIALKNFNSDLAVIDIQESQAHVKPIPSTERKLMETWIKENNIQIPKDKGFRYILEMYPNRPWLNY